MTNKILFIDDDANEARMLKDLLILAKLNPLPLIWWVPSIPSAVGLLNANLYEYDIILCDVNNTSLDFEKDVERLSHSNVIVTSQVLAPLGTKRAFVTKEDLATMVKSFYGGKK